MGHLGTQVLKVDGALTQHIGSVDRLITRVVNGHAIIYDDQLAIPGVQGQITGDTLFIGVLEVAEQVEVFQIGGHIRVHEHHGKLLLAITTGFGGGAVQSSALHDAVHNQGVLFNKLSVLAAGHGENALEDRQDGVLVNVLPVFGNLGGNIVHEVNTAGDVMGEVTLQPSLGTANDNHALLKGLGAGGHNVGLAVIVHGIAVQQTTHGNAGVAGAVLGGEHLTDVRVAHQDTGLADFVEAGAGHTVHRILERLGVKALSVKLRHNSKLLF